MDLLPESSAEEKQCCFFSSISEMIKHHSHLRLHTSNFYLFNFTAGNRCAFLQSTSFQLEKKSHQLKAKGNKVKCKENQTIVIIYKYVWTITVVKASLIVQLLHQFQDYYTPQHISLAGSWEFSMTPTGTLWYTFQVRSFYVCNHLKNQKDDYLILRLFVFTYIFAFFNLKRLCKYLRHTKPVREAITDHGICFFPTHNRPHQFFRRKFQFLDSFQASNAYTTFLPDY